MCYIPTFVSIPEPPLILALEQLFVFEEEMFTSSREDQELCLIFFQAFLFPTSESFLSLHSSAVSMVAPAFPSNHLLLVLKVYVSNFPIQYFTLL